MKMILAQVVVLSLLGTHPRNKEVASAKSRSLPGRQDRNRLQRHWHYPPPPYQKDFLTTVEVDLYNIKHNKKKGD